MKLLVTIASFGEKNLGILKRVISRYQGMSMEVDVVVLSEAPKQLDPKVKVVVGLPSKNPWSLPFAHKPVLAESVDRYDLFIYSEDDMEVTEDNINAFLKVTPLLADDEIAGYLRYEQATDGSRSLPDVHGAYRWKPESVKQRGNEVVAEFTNEHAAFYILSQKQLRRAIASGGFLRGPCAGRHDLACTAATDPYTNCGFRKVICVSALKDFLIHHASNRYAGQLGLPLSDFEEQVEAVVMIARNEHPASTLCPVEPKLALNGWWDKDFYEKSDEDLLKLVPKDVKAALSIGSGWGATEAGLRQRGVEVTVLPLDSIIGAVTARQGFKAVYGTLEECFRKLKGRAFDCILVSNLLHLLPNPSDVIEHCGKLLRKDGTLVASGPNFNYLPILYRRRLGKGEYSKLKDFSVSGINICGPRSLSRSLRKAGLQIAVVHRPMLVKSGDRLSFAKKNLRPFASRRWILQARRESL